MSPLSRQGRFFLYMITCVPTGKKYIGVTSASAVSRWADHCKSAVSGSNGYLHRAIRKYGQDNFRVRTLDTARSWAMICDKERHAITKHKTFGERGYNLTKGGEGGFGMRHSIKSKAQMSASHKKYFADPKVRSQLRDRQKLVMALPEVRAKLSASAKKRAATPEFRAAQSVRAKAQWANPKFRARKSAQSRKQWANPTAKWRTPEFRALRSALSKKAMGTKIARSRHSAAMIKAWADPAVRERYITLKKKGWADPKRRARHSAAIKKAWADPISRARYMARRAWTRRNRNIVRVLSEVA